MAEDWWRPHKEEEENLKLHKIFPTGHTVALGTGKAGKTTFGLRDKSRPSILAEYQDKYQQWDVCFGGCGENSRDKIFQTLYLVHGDRGFFKWHTSMDKEKWEYEIVENPTEKPKYVEVDDPSTEMKNFLNTR